MGAPDVHGPVDTLVIEFPSSTTGEQTAAALRTLVDSGVVRLYDFMVVRKGPDGTCDVVEPGAEAGGSLEALVTFAGARSGLVGPADLDDVTAVLEPDTAAIVLVYENAWAVPFVAAARGEGAELVASMRLSAQEIMDTLDADELEVTG